MGSSPRIAVHYSMLQVSRLDEWLSDAQRADLLAFQALAEARLEPATVYTTWVEQHSYSSHTAVCILHQNGPRPSLPRRPWCCPHRPKARPCCDCLLPGPAAFVSGLHKLVHELGRHENVSLLSTVQ